MSINYGVKVNERSATPVSGESHLVGILGVSTYSSGLIHLVQVPQSTMPSGVSITGSGGPYNEITSGSPTGGQFLVDYVTGVITFATSQNGNTVSVSYMGLGSEFAAEDVNEVQYPLNSIASLSLTYMSPYTSATALWTLSPNIVKPNNISNTNTDNFIFPNNVTISGLSSTGVVHNNASGVLSTSLIVNADVSASAAIAYSKLATLGGSTNDVLIQSVGGFVTPSSILSTNLFLADGSVAATGAFNLNSHQINNVTDPTSAQDAATKNYVDTHSATPAGSNTQVQYNNSGVFGANSGLTYIASNFFGIPLLAITGTSPGLNLQSTSGSHAIAFTNGAPSGNSDIMGALVASHQSSMNLYCRDGSPLLFDTTGDSGFNGGVAGQIQLRTAPSAQEGTPFPVIAVDATKIAVVSDSESGDASPTPVTMTPSAVFEARSTTRGFLPPRLTTTQRNAISSPATGLQIYNTTTSQDEFYNGSVWAAVGGSGSFDVNTIVTDVSGNVVVNSSGNVVVS